MYTGMLHLHSFLRWIILLLALIAVFRAFAGVNGKKPFTATDNKVGLFFMISMDIMLLIGLYQWFAGGTGLAAIRTLGMGDVMKNTVIRFFAVEHLTAMLLAVILVHVGRAAAKKNIPDIAKHRKALIFYGIALLLMLISIPWPFREAGAGRGWF
jgi:hypothetical protein